MHMAFLNPQGNFDPKDSYWTEHPDFGGQLVYVKQVALAMAALGHRVDIVTRLVNDPHWPEFSQLSDEYPGAPGVRIVRLPAGPPDFLAKEELWPHLVNSWVPAFLKFYRTEGNFPQAITTHYGDGGLCGVLIEAQTGIPFTFTAHSLGAQKLDKLQPDLENLAVIDRRYHFSRRIFAERLSMNRSAVNITSTTQERNEQYNHPAYWGVVDVKDGRRFAVIPPGVNLAIFGAKVRTPDETTVRTRALEHLRRDLSPDRINLPVIIASSRLEPKKNHLGLVQAFAQNPHLQQISNLVFITGALDDPLRDDQAALPAERQVLAQIRQVVSENNLWGKISAFAVQGQAALAAVYRGFAERRSVFSLTALYEPFGLAPLEAAAAGLPVIVTQNGGPSESLRDGKQEYGILVDPSDPIDIGRGLERVLADTESWLTFAKRGQQRVLDRYTWERTAHGYLEIIEEIVANPEARRASQKLLLHPYFLHAAPEYDISLDELWNVYNGKIQ